MGVCVCWRECASNPQTTAMGLIEGCSGIVIDRKRQRRQVVCCSCACVCVRVPQWCNDSPREQDPVLRLLHDSPPANWEELRRRRWKRRRWRRQLSAPWDNNWLARMHALRAAHTPKPTTHSEMFISHIPPGSSHRTVAPTRGSFLVAPEQGFEDEEERVRRVRWAYSAWHLQSHLSKQAIGPPHSKPRAGVTAPNHTWQLEWQVGMGRGRDGNMKNNKL